MNRINRRELAAPAAMFVIGLAAILGAWGFELIGGYVPCKLCLEERLPYYFGLPVVLIALIAAAAGLRPGVSRTLLAVGGIIFIAGVYLGGYHAGAEWGFWPGPTDCGGGSATPTSAGDLINALKNIHVVNCTEAAFRFPPAAWGLSFAGWNAVVSLVLVVMALWGTLRAPAATAAPRTLVTEAGGR